MSSKRLCELTLQRLKKLQTLIGVRSVALAGQLPSIMRTHGIELLPPFVDGKRGAVFAITETIDEVIKRNGMTLTSLRIAIVGVGFVGGRLMKVLREIGCDVVGVDIKANFSERESTEDHAIQDANLVVVLTPRGSDFRNYERFLQKGVIIIDDTHPKITSIGKDSILYKVAVGLDGVRFLPKLPGYNVNWIPGCAIEAIYLAETGEFKCIPQDVFNGQAKKLGFYAHVREIVPERISFP